MKSIILGIKHRDDFPPVIVEKSLDGSYRLSSYTPVEGFRGRLDRGHTRAMAHFIKGEPLRCRFPNTEWDFSPYLEYFNNRPPNWRAIDEIPILSDPLEWIQILKEKPNYCLMDS